MNYQSYNPLIGDPTVPPHDAERLNTPPTLPILPLGLELKEKITKCLEVYKAKIGKNSGFADTTAEEIIQTQQVGAFCRFMANEVDTHEILGAVINRKQDSALPL